MPDNNRFLLIDFFFSFCVGFLLIPLAIDSRYEIIRSCRDVYAMVNGWLAV